MDAVTLISNKLNIKSWQVKSVIELVKDDNTVHFIARYRKEKTGDIDENLIREIIEENNIYEKLVKAKEIAIKNIEEQGKLTPELQKKITDSKTLLEVEDLYAPYKRIKKTKADIAIEKGFMPIAKQIKYQEQINIPKYLIEKYSNQEIIGGAKDIVSQEIADDANLKNLVRQQYLNYGIISSKIKTKIEEKALNELHKFQVYKEFSSSTQKIKSYQTLALNRGEDLGILNITLEKDEVFYDKFEQRIVRESYNKEPLIECVKSGYKKIFLSIEKEVRNVLTQSANIDAIKSFQDNLKNLLMLKPHYGERVFAIDPGYRTGCKVCLLDENGIPVKFDKFYLEKVGEAKQIISKFIKECDVVVIGNGTGTNEAQELIGEYEVPVIVVNESGASVYSTSQVGGEEFPNLDATERGTVSIGRRYLDSLSELVKIPVESIGVGMYQHDMNEKELIKKLGETVEDVVNLVGININSASPYLLSYVSGLTKLTAKKIYANRPYKTRAELEKILSKKAYQQCVGFLRVIDGINEFDNTSIHPEQYEIAKRILKNDTTDIPVETVNEIKKSFENAGKELRLFEGTLKQNKKITLDDLKVGDKVNGIIRNVAQFGAFVDIGLKNDGLIHISELADKFVKDPTEIVKVGQEVSVKVISLDKEKGKINLSLKQN